MNNETLRSGVNVALVELALVHSLASSVSAPTNVKTQLPIIWHLVITIEGTKKHHSLIRDIAVA